MTGVAARVAVGRTLRQENRLDLRLEDVVIEHRRRRGTRSALGKEPQRQAGPNCDFNRSGYCTHAVVACRECGLPAVPGPERGG